MDAIFFCIHCAERFCSQECFGRHAATHAGAYPSVVGAANLVADRISRAPWEGPTPASFLNF